MIDTFRHLSFNRLNLLKTVYQLFQVVQSETPIIDHTGKPMEAIDVFSKTIQCFRDHVKKSIKTKRHITVQDDQLFFVFTIPAPGTDAAKKFMKDAATDVRIIIYKLFYLFAKEATNTVCTNHLNFFN